MFYQNTRSPSSGRQTGSGVISTALAALIALAPGPGFTARVDNPRFPLRPGTVSVYTGMKDGQRARDVVTVTHRVANIDGAPRRARTRDDDRGHLAGGTRRREVGNLHARSACSRPDGTPGVLQRPCRGPLRGSQPPRARLRPIRVVAQRIADEGVDAARAGRRRPQALRARYRHGARADRERRRRTPRAGLRPATLIHRTTSTVPNLRAVHRRNTAPGPALTTRRMKPRVFVRRMPPTHSQRPSRKRCNR